MRIIYSLCILFLQQTVTPCYAQKVYLGKVVDETKMPVEWANVVVKDTLHHEMIAGVVSDSVGNFKILASGNQHDLQICIRCLGYKTLTMPLDERNENRVFTLHSDRQMLSEIVVKSYRRPFHMNGDVLTAQVEGTLLSESGTLDDLVNKIPFVTTSNGDFSVFGRGNAIVYLNGKRVYDNMQLSGITSMQIKKIEVITNPGPKYKAETNAVIKIYTIRLENDGIGYSLNGRISQGRLPSGFAGGSLLYKRGKLDMSGSFTYSRIGSKNSFDDETSIISSPTSKTSRSTSLKDGCNYYFTGLSGNYNINDSSNVGINANLFYYNRNLTVDMPDMRHYYNGELTRQTPTYSLSDEKPFRLTTNAYYTVKIGKTNLELTNEFLKGEKENDFLYRETLDEASIHTLGKMYYLSNSTMVDFSSNIDKLKLSYGGELTYTDDKQTYNYDQQNIETPLQASSNKRRQLLTAGYAGIAFRSGICSGNIGTRYEYVSFSYYENNVKSDQQSRNYGNILPYLNFDLSFSPKCMLSLGYRVTLNRPSYEILNDEIQTEDRYTYKQGNSLLRPELIHSLNGLFNIGDFKLIGQYNIIKDQALRPRTRYAADSDIVYGRMVNIPTYHNYSLGLSWNRRFGFYTPYAEVYFGGQDFKYHYLSSNYDFSNPYISFRINNTFSFPKKVNMNVQVGYNSRKYIAFIENSHNWYSSISISKGMKCGLYIQLGISNIPGTRRTSQIWRTNDIYDRSIHSSDSRSVFLMLSYNFHPRASRYTHRRSSAEMKRF